MRNVLDILKRDRSNDLYLISYVCTRLLDGTQHISYGAWIDVYLDQNEADAVSYKKIRRDFPQGEVQFTATKVKDKDVEKLTVLLWDKKEERINHE